MASAKNLIGTLLLVALSLAVAPGSRAGEPEGGLFVNLTTHDVWRAGMALGFAHNVLKAGHKLTVFLNVDAVTIAAKDIPQHTNALLGMTLQDKLKAIMADGGKVIVCPMCMRQAGLTPDELIDGVTVGTPPVTIPALMAPGVKVMSY